MIDVHSHVLFGIDDGSESIEESMNMLSTLVSSGVTDVFLTPHYRNPYIYEKQVAIDKFNELKTQVQNQQLPINLYLGQEIKFNDESYLKLQKGELLTLNSTKCILVEFDFHKEEDISEAVYSLKKKGFIPIVAHPERYFYMDSIEKFEEIKSVGGLIQINAESVLGKCGGRIKKLVHTLIKYSLVDFIAGDYHYCREYYMIKAYDLILKKYGKELADGLFGEHQKIMLLSGKYDT